KTANQFLVGFALETENEKDNALKKLKAKNADMIVLNSLNDEGGGFGDTNRVSIFYKDGTEKKFETKPKAEVAKDIVTSVFEFINK
ncbi:MAG: phosphopantothenoylcysteine decarboxylase, partial [Chitinophagaceae bacterium]